MHNFSYSNSKVSILQQRPVFEDSEWQDVPKIRVLQDEESKHKSASEKIDMLIMALPDSPNEPVKLSGNGNSVRSPKYSHISPHSSADWAKKLLTTSKSIPTLCDRRESEPSPDLGHRRNSEQFEDSHNFSDSNLNNADSCSSLGNSSFYCPYPENEEQMSIQFAPRFSSMRNHSNSKPGESVIQKFKKSFSLRFHRGQNEQFLSEPSTPVPGGTEPSLLPSHFFCINDQIILGASSPSSHPATVAGVSPMTVRKNEPSPVSMSIPYLPKDNSTKAALLPLDN